MLTNVGNYISKLLDKFTHFRHNNIKLYVQEGS